MINNKIVLVTGSTRGIGKAIAKKYLLNNYKVVINGSSSEKAVKATVTELQELANNNINNNNINIIGIKCDVSNYIQVTSMFAQIKQTFGATPDILINNAGISHIGLFSDMQEEHWNKIIDVNLKGVINCCHVASKSMIANRNGNIINISSIWGEVGASCEAIYSATKGGVNSFTKGLAKELGSTGIRVNAVSCGLIQTPMNNNIAQDDIDQFVEDIGMMRIGQSSEVADVVYYLSGDNSSYITGQVITVDGGYI